MSILIDEKTRLIIQGITGREGTFHTGQMLEYGSNVVAGVTPGKGGQQVLGVPVYNTVREAREATGADASVLFVPARHMATGIKEAVDAGVQTIVTIAEHVPVHDMLTCTHLARAGGVRLFGPNSFGIISPGKCKAGFMAHRIFSPGPVGLMSRSATNCYETVLMLTQMGIGQSTCVGIGGDRIPGTAFVDLIPLFQADPETKIIALIGEIGGGAEEEAARRLVQGNTKPVVALIAGKNAPRGTGMGHAGAIVAADGRGSAEGKEAALRAAGCHIAASTEDMARIIAGLLKEAETDVQ